MSQPVKLSDALVLDARIAGRVLERSIAGQVEFWAKLGQAVEPLLNGKQLLELRRIGNAKPLSELVASVETAEGRARTLAYLESRPYPHYRQVPEQPRTYIRTDADGTETVGRFVNRAFVPVESHPGRDSVPRGHAKSDEEPRAEPKAEPAQRTA
jgi:hypothetical protein